MARPRFLLETIFPFCPHCGSRLVIKKNKTSSKYFLGCPLYPECIYGTKFEEWNLDSEQLQAEFYISPKTRLSMEGAGSLGTYIGPVPMINQVDGRSTD